jgi:two-component system, NarL family, invasion response regulator UvrY
MVKIFLVDDHEILREGIKKVLQKTPDFQVVGEAETGRQAIKMVKDTDIDVLLLDISLPDIEGLDVLIKVHKNKPNLPVIIFTMHDENTSAIRYMKAGASGYLTKGSPPKQLIEAIRTAVTGRKFLTPLVGDLLIQDWRSNTNKPLHENLSNREFTVFKLIASGKTVSQIADTLFLETSTISTYRRRILEKMSLRSNAELTSYAYKNKLI